MKPKISYYCINLEESILRKETSQAEFKKAFGENKELNFFPAITFSDLAEHYKFQLLKPGKNGCFYSHIFTWLFYRMSCESKIDKSDMQWLFVFEDDFKILDPINFRKIVESVLSDPINKDTDIIKFGGHFSSPEINNYLTGTDNQFVFKCKETYGNYAYAVNVGSIRNIISCIFNFKPIVGSARKFAHKEFDGNFFDIEPKPEFSVLGLPFDDFTGVYLPLHGFDTRIFYPFQVTTYPGHSTIENIYINHHEGRLKHFCRVLTEDELKCINIGQ